jgi:predicted CoA-binding protein
MQVSLRMKFTILLYYRCSSKFMLSAAKLCQQPDTLGLECTAFLYGHIKPRTMSSQQPDMQQAAKTFFSSSHFAVAGASSNTSKFGHRIFAWYLQHKLPAIPLNPTCSSVTVRGQQYQTVASPSKLEDPTHTSLSVITPPPVTAKLLQEAKEAGIRAVWLQPGSFTDKELNYAVEQFPGAAVGGFSDGTVGGEGWCVLVDGETAMKAAGRQEKL